MDAAFRHRRGLLLSAEGLKLAGLPVDAAFRHRTRPFVIHGDGLKMKARRERLADRRRSSSGCSLSSCSEGLKLAGRPMDAAFRHPWR